MPELVCQFWIVEAILLEQVLKAHGKVKMDYHIFPKFDPVPTAADSWVVGDSEDRLETFWG